MLAPIILFVYNRSDHTEKTLQYLSKNILAKDSELFIFSDGPKDNSSFQEVNLVRKCINEQIWQEKFKKVTVFESDTNRGLAESVISGVTKIIKKFEKVIVLEDDLLTDIYFLKYMNEALDFYSSNSSIWSISGFNIPIKLPKDYKHEVYLSYRGSSWGWGTWKNRWDNVDWEISDYVEFQHNEKKVKKFNQGGRDLSLMLENQMEGKIDSWAIRWVYSQSKLNKYTVYPKFSMVKNIGLDGTGTHSPQSNKYFTELKNERVLKLEDIEPDNRILIEFQKNYLSFLQYLFYKWGKKINKSIRKRGRKL